MSDGKKVQIARRLQKLHEKAALLIEKLEEIDADAASDMIDQCFGVAWPEHVIKHYIDPQYWEVTSVGIERRRRNDNSTT